MTDLNRLDFLEYAAQSHPKVLFLHAVGGKFCLIIFRMSCDKSCSQAEYSALYFIQENVKK